jgi:hypothetical protein
MRRHPGGRRRCERIFEKTNMAQYYPDGAPWHKMLRIGNEKNLQKPSGHMFFKDLAGHRTEVSPSFSQARISA